MPDGNKTCWFFEDMVEEVDRRLSVKTLLHIPESAEAS